MLDKGLTLDGAAQALAWPRARVTARVKLLELPELAQKMIGAGVLPSAAIEPLRAIGAISPEILDVVVNHLHGGGWGANRFVNEPGYVLAEALRTADASDVFGAYLNTLNAPQIERLKLGKRATEQYAQIVELEKKLDRYAYGHPQVPFSEEDVDQARAAGVLIDLDGSQPLLVDRALYRELAKQAIKRHVQTLTDRVAVQAQQRTSANASDRQADPAQDARRQHGRDMRALAEQAHNANLDLGWALRNGLSVVDPADLDVARFFCFALLQSDSDSTYGSYADRARDLATRGIRLVIEDFRTDVTKTKKDGTRGALRISYGQPNDTKATREWLWKFLDGAKTAGELYGRTLVVIAAERYALRQVVPTSQQHRPTHWASHKDQAEKALTKLVGPHLPATLKQLEKAIAKAKAAHERELAAIRTAQRAEATGNVDEVHECGELGDEEYDDDPGEHVDD